MHLALITVALLSVSPQSEPAAQPAQAEPQMPSNGAPPIPPSAVGQSEKVQTTAQQKVQTDVQQAVTAEQLKGAQNAAATAQEELAQLKSNKLLSLGFTGGLALSVQTPSPITNSTALHTGVGSTTMPYVMLLPAYWGASEANRHFCASSWSTGDEDSAMEAALGITRRAATRQFRAALNALKAGLPDEMIISTLFTDNPRVGREMLPRIRELLDEKAPDFEAKSSYIITTLAYSSWAPTLRGDCGWKKLGLWIGKPSLYSVKTRASTETSSTTRDFTPLAAFGVGFAPNAYFSILAGFTVGTFKVPGPDMTPADSDIAWAGTVAVGGNLDLAGALFK